MLPVTNNPHDFASFLGLRISGAAVQYLNPPDR